MRDWQTAVDGLSNVQKLVHLAARNDVVDEERYRADLLRVRRRAAALRAQLEDLGG